jgi:hypothetical protein
MWTGEDEWTGVEEEEGVSSQLSWTGRVEGFKAGCGSSWSVVILEE